LFEKKVIKESKNRGKAPIYPMLARLSPSTSSGLQTLLAKVKKHIKDRGFRQSIAVGFVLGGGFAKGGRGGPLRRPGARGRGCLWGEAEASERSGSDAGGVIETALSFSCYFFCVKTKEVRKACCVDIRVNMRTNGRVS